MERQPERLLEIKGVSESLARRGPWRGATAAEHEAFLQWDEAYWRRRTPTSFAGHLALFEHFAETKIRFERRSEIEAFLADVHRDK